MSRLKKRARKTFKMQSKCRTGTSNQGPKETWDTCLQQGIGDSKGWSEEGVHKEEKVDIEDSTADASRKQVDAKFSSDGRKPAFGRDIGLSFSVCGF